MAELIGSRLPPAAIAVVRLAQRTGLARLAGGLAGVALRAWSLPTQLRALGYDVRSGADGATDAEIDALYRGREVLQAYLFRVTRSGDLEGDEGAGDLLQAIEEDTRRRAGSAVVRVEVERAMPPSLRSMLLT